jgi:hypothetical protein
VRYSDVENALKDVLRIKQPDVGAFRARLRHLRNLDLPRVAKAGSGRAADYSSNNVLEMLLALELENAGVKPERAATVSQSMVRLFAKHHGKDCYVAVDKERPGYSMMHGKKGVSDFLDRAPDAFLMVNISGCVRRLDDALSKIRN